MGEVNNFMCDYLGLAKYNADFWNGTVFRGKRKVKVWQLMGALIGKKGLKKFRQKGGGLDMCKAFEDEREEGREEGRSEGALEMLYSLVKDGIIKLEEAAKRVNMSEEGFMQRMQGF